LKYDYIIRYILPDVAAMVAYSDNLKHQNGIHNVKGWKFFLYVNVILFNLKKHKAIKGMQ
jgi:hypothetical protein